MRLAAGGVYSSSPPPKKNPVTGSRTGKRGGMGTEMDYKKGEKRLSDELR